MGAVAETFRSFPGVMRSYNSSPCPRCRFISLSPIIRPKRVCVTARCRPRQQHVLSPRRIPRSSETNSDDRRTCPGKRTADIGKRYEDIELNEEEFEQIGRAFEE